MHTSICGAEGRVQEFNNACAVSPEGLCLCLDPIVVGGETEFRLVILPLVFSLADSSRIRVKDVSGLRGAKLGKNTFVWVLESLEMIVTHMLQQETYTLFKLESQSHPSTFDLLLIILISSCSQ